MTRTNYPKPSNLLLLLKLTGKSYWDMIGYPLPEVTVTASYPHELRVWNTVNLARYGFNEPEFLRRLDYNDRRYIKTPYGGESTHLMTNDGNYAYPNILDINGTLHNYDKKYGDYWNRDPKENGDYIKFLTPGDARYFAEHYKKNWPIFFQGAFKDGKDILPGFKGGFDSFANGVGRAIYNEMIANGWYTPARYDNIMSLLSSESGHGTSMLATKYHNYGGRKNAKGGYMHFKDDSAFAKDHLAYLQRMHRAAWNAKDTMDYVKALKASNYMSDNIYHYYNLLKGQLSARKAWNAAMKTWGLPKLVIKTAITEPVDATRVAKPVMEIPVPVEQPRQLQPTAYIDPTLLFNQSEEVLLPVVEDNYEASLLPSIQDAMLYFLPSLTPFANNDFMSLLVQVGLPGAKYGKDVLPGFELGTPPPEMQENGGTNMIKTTTKNKVSVKVGDVDYGIPFIWTPDTIKAAGYNLTTDGKTRFSVEGIPYELAGYGEVNGARVGIGKALDGKYEAVYQPLKEVTVTASPGKSLKTASGDYANTSDDYYKWRVGTQFANNVNKACLGMMAGGTAPIAISATPLSVAWNAWKPFIPDILAGTEIGTGADLAMKLGSGRTYGEWGLYYLSPYLKKYMSPETANVVGDLAGESLNPGGWFGSYKNLRTPFILNNTKKSIAGTTVGLLLRNNNNLLNNIHGIIPGEYLEQIVNNGAKSEIVDNPFAIYVQRMYNEGFKPTNIKIARTDSDAAKIFANNIIKMRHSNNPATKIQYETIKKLVGQDIDSLGENELQKVGNLLFYGAGSSGDVEGAFGGMIHYAKDADARAFKRSGYDISGIPENKAELLVLVHEWEHINGVPYNPIPEGTISKIGLGKLFDYFNNFNNTEVGARIAQVLSSFGVTDKSNITGYELKKYFLKYINDPHSIPNNMKLLYHSVLDWDKLANWARNKNNVRTIIGATTIGYSASKNKK